MRNRAFIKIIFDTVFLLLLVCYTYSLQFRHYYINPAIIMLQSLHITVYSKRAYKVSDSI